MKIRTMRVAGLTVAVMLVWPIHAAGDLDMTRSTIDGGGGASSGGQFELSGTIGQPDAGVMTGGSFALAGGFWLATPPGDCDGDGDVDLADFEALESCFVGPGASVSGDCRCYDFDRNGSVDLADFGAFAASYTGP